MGTGGIVSSYLVDRLAFSAELQEALKQRFETIGMAKVSTSAAEARGLDLLKSSDKITLHRERLLLDARETALHQFDGRELAIAKEFANLFDGGEGEIVFA